MAGKDKRTKEAKIPMTMTQKILAAHSGLNEVHPGQFIAADVDVILANDITGPQAIVEFYKMEKTKVADASKIVLVPDHTVPNRDVDAATLIRELNGFAKKQKITNYFELGETGIEHVILPEKGLVTAGDMVIGADSHTSTYGALGAFSTGVGVTDIASAMATGKAWFKVPPAIRFDLIGKPARWVSGKDIILHIIGMIGIDGANYRSMEFAGEGVAQLTMDDRFAISNMAAEAGAKNGIFPVDERTLAYISSHKNKIKRRRPTVFKADKEAIYERTIEINLSNLRPMVAFPYSPNNTRTIDSVGNVKIDQAVIGGCTNGRIDDMAVAAKMMKGHYIAPGSRCIILPGSQQVYLDCVRLGYAEIFLKAGCIISPPTCGPCYGSQMGALAAGERAVSTTSRNYVGRMGHPDSQVYLTSPAVATASVIAGKLIDPEKLMGK